MTLNKRERNLLLLLAVIVIAFVYYQFLMTPLRASLQELQTDKQVQEEKYNAMQQVFSKEAPLDKQIAAANEGSKLLATDLFGALTQEDIMVLFYDLLSEGNIELAQLNFTEPRIQVSTSEQAAQQEEANEQDFAKVYSLQLRYKAAYQDLVDFLQAIREYERRITVSNMQLSDISDGVLTGDIAFDFYSVPYVDQYFPERANLLAAKQFEIDRIKLENPFVFFKPEEVIVEEVDPYPDWSPNPYPWENNEESKEPEEEPVVENWMTLYGFADQRYFFVGNPREVYGSVTPEKQAAKGNSSAKLQYDFLRGRDYSAANLVFDGDAVQIARQPEFLGMSIYAYETNNHKIGLIVIDSAGRQYKVPLADKVDWSGWQTIKTKLPIEVTYPAIVQRIYIESHEVSGKLNGSFLFDTVEVLYPDMISGNGEQAVKSE